MMCKNPDNKDDKIGVNIHPHMVEDPKYTELKLLMKQFRMLVDYEVNKTSLSFLQYHIPDFAKKTIRQVYKGTRDGF